MRKTYHIRDQKIVEAENGDGAILVYVNPDEKEKKYLVDELKIDEHTLHSALDPDELSRLEFEPDHAAIIFKRPKNASMDDMLSFRVASLGLFLFRDRLVVVSMDDEALFDGRARPYPGMVSLVRIALRLINRSTVAFLGHLKGINAVAGELEQKINTAFENRQLLNLFALEKSLVYYLSASHSNGVLLERLRNSAAKIGFSADDVEFLDDIVIENTQCCKQSEIYSNILASLMDARASIVNNNLQGLMKTLTLITLCIMVPTFVVSAFSMNVEFPFQHHPYGFSIIMALAGTFTVIFILLARKLHW